MKVVIEPAHGILNCDVQIPECVDFRYLNQPPYFWLDAEKGHLKSVDALAGSLLDSLDHEVDEDAEAAWQVEIERRLKELDSGKVKLVPWVEARRRLSGR